MRNPIRLSYCTLYNYSFKEEEITQTNIRTREVCFSGIFAKIRKHLLDDKKEITLLKVNVTLLNSYNYFEKDGYNNYCFFSKKEIRYYLNYLSKLFNFTYVLKDIKYNKNPITIIQCDFKNCSYIEIKAALTGVRYLYEIPYSFVLKEALHFKKYGLCKYLSLYNLLYAVSSRIGNCGGGHGFFNSYYISTFISTKKIKENMLKTTQVNDILPGIEYKKLIKDGNKNHDKFIEKFFTDRYYNEYYKTLLDLDVEDLKKSNFYSKEKVTERYNKYLKSFIEETKKLKISLKQK